MSLNRTVIVHSAAWLNTPNTNFPGDVSNLRLNFSGVFPWLASVANGGKVYNANGYDIWFSTTIDPGRSFLLRFQRVIWDAVTGRVEFWIKIPLLQASGDLQIFLNYSDPSVSVDLQNIPGNTFAEDYAAVWHFGDGTTLDLQDNSGQGNGVTNSGVPVTAGTGLLSADGWAAAPPEASPGGGAVFGGSSYLSVNTPNGLDITGPLSIEAIVQVPTNYGSAAYRTICCKSDLSTHGYRLALEGGASFGLLGPIIRLEGYSGGGLQATAIGGADLSIVAIAQASPVIGSWDGTSSSSGPPYNVQALGDGELGNPGFPAINQGHVGSWTTPAIGDPSGSAFVIGADSGHGTTWVGTIDELRVLKPAFVPSLAYLSAVVNSAAYAGGVNTGAPRTDWFYEISAEAVTPISINCGSSTAGTVGTPYSHAFPYSGGVYPYTFSIVSGSLPPGLTLNLSTGVVTGTPTTAGTYPFTIEIADSSTPPLTASKNCSITIASSGSTLTVVCGSPPAGTVGVAYSHAVTATGGTPPYSFALILGSSLPPGLTMDGTGLITGTPTTAGAFPFTVQVTDSVGATNTVNCSITISAPSTGNNVQFFLTRVVVGLKPARLPVRGSAT